MTRKNVNFGDKKRKKVTFIKTKIDDIEANKILVSKEEPCGTKNSLKYFIGYNDNDNDVIRLLCIRLPQMTGYVRTLEANTTMSFNDSDRLAINNFQKKYNQIWKRVEEL